MLSFIAESRREILIDRKPDGGVPNGLKDGMGDTDSVIRDTVRPSCSGICVLAVTSFPLMRSRAVF